ncbi:helix-turn-helix transcriptional regulator [Rummeliibacillus sp. POC4]|uniref:helix-turn-helix domain-containing protein n=1 Tax=Rummeliibacillus sp. POC4 TaxID=2305899 RepID=UPI002101D391|nr:helix-turn-helix transcriptional regulator [Rummeliibacillus sp. POC4]
MMAEQFLSITELSEKTGISRNTLTKIYHEKSEFSTKTLRILCNFFKCTPNEFLVIGKHF